MTLPLGFWIMLACAAAPTVVAAEPLARFEGDTLAAYREAGGERALRRTSLTSLMRGRPAWSVAIDIAALGRTANKDWRLDSADCLPPVYRRCLLFLTEAGKPGVALREYDTVDRRLIDDGFTLPPGPTKAAWYDENRIMIAANTAPGALSAKGVPRLLKLWTRGEPSYGAATILAAPFDVAGVRPVFSLSGGGLFHAAEVTLASGAKELYHFGWAQNFRRSALPARSTLLDFFQGRAVVLLGEDWTYVGRRFAAGGIVAYPLAPLLGPASRTLPELAYVPPGGLAVVRARAGRDALYVQLRGGGGDRLVSIRKGAPDWPATDVAVPGAGPMTLVAASDLADVALVARGAGRLYVAGRGKARDITP